MSYPTNGGIVASAETTGVTVYNGVVAETAPGLANSSVSVGSSVST